MNVTIASKVRDLACDTTSDITSQDQCSVVIRHVTDIVHERLGAVIRCEASTGLYFAQLVNYVPEIMNMDGRHCIGSSTDGASDMQGQ